MANSEQDLYRRIKLLGEGSFGKAYLVECITDKSLCVIKQVDLTQMKEEERRETIKEARILEALRHPNIVKFREVYKTKKGRLCIVMDYADGGDLGQKIRDAGTTLMSEFQILDWFTQICLALKHVHDRKIIHRDLKSQNIFLTKEGIIKMGDFGIARVLNHTREKCKTMVGTPYYLSPEIIDSRDYSFKTDIWSLGVILYELCALKPPFNAESLHGLALKIVRGQYPPLPDRYSPEVRNLVKSLLNVDPLRRPNIHEVLKMPVLLNRIRSVLSESVRNLEFSHTILHKQNFVNKDLVVPYDDDLARKKNQAHSQPILKASPSAVPLQHQPSQPLSQLQKQKQMYQQHQPLSNQEYLKPPYALEKGQYAAYQPPLQQQDRYCPYQNRFNIIKDKKPSVSPMRGVYERQPVQAPARPIERDKSPIEKQVYLARQALNNKRVEPPLMIQECAVNNRYGAKDAQKSPLQRIQSAHQQLNKINAVGSTNVPPQAEENSEKTHQSTPAIVEQKRCQWQSEQPQLKDSQQLLKDIQKKGDREEERQKMKRDIQQKRGSMRQKNKENEEVQIEFLNVHESVTSLSNKKEDSKSNSQELPPMEPEDDATKILAELEVIINNAELPSVQSLEMVQECTELNSQLSDREDGESLPDDDEREVVHHVDLLRSLLEEQLGTQEVERQLEQARASPEQYLRGSIEGTYEPLLALLEAMQHLKLNNLNA